MVRTRFAPSPTGYLHIGGVRTALFNWLFARKHGGQFLLRIDDTDAERNVAAALAPILHGFRWLGIDWDEGPTDDGQSSRGPHAPYFQSQRQDRYREAVEQLLANGFAYRDYASTEEIQTERTAAEKEKRSVVYSRRWMAESDADARRYESEGRKAVVRLKTPREGSLVIPDVIRGNVEFQWASEQDHVVQRADGTCLYHLANVVDDYDFEITHVIRAEEHLSNTPRQIFIAQSLGYPLPQYAHLPYVAEPGSKNKLSKRKLDKYLKNPDFAKINEHGQAIARAIGLATAAETFNPVIVDFYEQVGYLPHAVLNYLLLLGWSLDETTEFFSREEMIERFTLERVNKAPASFDPKKLFAFQDHYMQELPLKQKVAKVLPYLQRAGSVSEPPPCSISDKLQAIVTAAGDRIKVAGDILDYRTFFTPDEQITYDAAAFDKRIRKPPEAAPLLAKFKDRLATVEPFDAATIEKALHDFIAAEGIQISGLIHPLRVAVTGQSIGFGLFETLAVLGRESSVRRIGRALQRCHYAE
ncbi:MAG: glutamate--tRNA ligase [Pirellulales bacterium]